MQLTSLEKRVLEVLPDGGLFLTASEVADRLGAIGDARDDVALALDRLCSLSPPLAVCYGGGYCANTAPESGLQ